MVERTHQDGQGRQNKVAEAHWCQTNCEGHRHGHRVTQAIPERFGEKWYHCERCGVVIDSNHKVVEPAPLTREEAMRHAAWERLAGLFLSYNVYKTHTQARHAASHFMEIEGSHKLPEVLTATVPKEKYDKLQREFMTLIAALHGNGRDGLTADEIVYRYSS